MKRATIKDVAAEAGVSIATVSNAFHNPEVLHKETLAQVLRAAEKLSYYANQNSQRLRQKETRAIGLFVASMAGSFYGVLADTMHWECVKHGYELYIYIVNKPETILNNIIGRRVDGAGILYDEMPEDLTRKLNQSGCPVVYLDREMRGETVSSVIFDSLHEGELAARYLISLGHRDLMHVYGLRGNFDSIRRFEGFQKALDENGLTLKAENVLMGLFERDAAYREMKHFLEKGHPLPDAVFASNDLSAIGVIEALKDENVRVPEDVSVIGCDDIGVCELLDPPITTLHTSFENQGVIAIRQLMKMLSGQKPGDILKIEGRLVIRRSCLSRQPRAYEGAANL